jgi:hypothetical protein
MSRYLSGAIVLADARQRLRRVGAEFGILVVEGADDGRLFRRHAVAPELVLPVGGKGLLLDAFAGLRPTEEKRIVFVVDCDYDAPLRRLPLGEGNLIITAHPALETDLFALRGVAEVIAEELVSGDRLDSDGRAHVADALRARTVALSDAVGRIRWAAAVEDMKLNFQVDVSRFRRQGSAIVDEERLLEAIVRNSGSIRLTIEQLRQVVAGLERGLISCRGHDIVDALADVLNRDFGVTRPKCKALPEVLRMAIDAARLEDWNVVSRLRAWESANGRVVLNRQSAA